MIHKPLHPGEIVRETCIDGTGLTVTEVAKKLGVDRSTLSRLVNGRIGISAEMAVRLSIALNTPAIQHPVPGFVSKSYISPSQM